MLAMPTASIQNPALSTVTGVGSATSTSTSSSNSACGDESTESLASTTAAAAAGHIHAVPTPKDTTWTKLFVGGLPYHTTDKSLRDHFKVYGEIDEAVVITDRQTGKSRGYGFVIMADRVSAERAIKEPNPIIDGRKANVNLAILGAKPRGNVASAALAASAAFPFTATAIRPGGFPGTVSSAALLAASQYGLPAAGGYIYQPAAATSAAAYGGTPLLSLQSPAATSPALAAAIAAQAQHQHQFYDPYHHQATAPVPVTVSSTAPGTVAAAAGQHHLGSSAQVAAAQAFAALAADPYTSTYLAQQLATGQANGPYAAYLPAASQAGTASQTASILPYAAAVAQDSSRLQ